MGAEGRLKPPVVRKPCPPIPVVRSPYPPKPPVVKSTYRMRVCQNILPLSQADKVPEALKEWFFNGYAEDHDKPVATCELCDKYGLRYRFQIENHLNQNKLWVGSECILKFAIPVYEAGVLLDRRGARRKLNNLMKRRQHESCVKVLEGVVKKENDPRSWDILRSALEYYRQHERLTPKYAFVVFWRLKYHKIDHIPKFFKVGLTSRKDKTALRDMSPRHVHMIWPALSPGQRQLAVRLGHCPPGDPPTGGSRAHGGDR